jgi:hypothetical protein
LLVGLWDGGTGSYPAEVLIDGTQEGYFTKAFIGIAVLVVGVVIVSTGETNFTNPSD